LALAVLATPALAGQVEQSLSFQARLTDDSGVPLEGVHTLDFFIFDVETGGKPIGSITDLEVDPSDGIVSLALPVDPAWFNGVPRYLAITVDDLDDDPADDELLPRTLLTSVPYSLRTASITPSAVINVQGGNFGGDVTVLGNVGIGTSSPSYRLHVESQVANAIYGLATSGGNAAGLFGESYGTTGRGVVGIASATTGATRGVVGEVSSHDGLGGYFRNDADPDSMPASPGAIALWVDGKLAVGKDLDENQEATLYVDNALSIAHASLFPPQGSVLEGRWGTYVLANHSLHELILGCANDLYSRAEIRLADDNTAFGHISLRTGGTGVTTRLYINGQGNVGIGTTSPGAKLDVVGTTRTGVLVITGGADLAEPFAIAPALDGCQIEPGMVVAIDSNHPGRLALATEPYDCKVAGVISGANGLSPGMVMRSEGNALADGEHNVALSGRVWCWCNSSYGAIRPGDRLTTSATAGHAMRVADPSRAPGTVIGKAMTALEEGRGLVLMLVQPQ
jgi:hypothetical protein